MKLSQSIDIRLKLTEPKIKDGITIPEALGAPNC